MQLQSMTMFCALCLLGLAIGSFADSYGGGNLYGQSYGYSSYMPYPYYGYGGYGQGGAGGGVGNGAFFALIGLLFIIILLFSNAFNFTSSSSTPVISTG